MRDYRGWLSCSSKELISSCDPNQDGYTALHLAVESGQSDIVEALLGYGASVQVKTEQSGETPLHIASRVTGGRPCAELLLKSGAEVNALQLALETPLHVAARNGHLDTVATLLDDGATLELQNQLGENALHVAVSRGHRPVCEHLLQALQDRRGRAAVERIVNQPNRQGESSVHYAAVLEQDGDGVGEAEGAENRRLIMQALIKAGADVSLGTLQTLETPIHYCCKSGNIAVLKEIIAQLQPIDAQIACNKQAKVRLSM